MPQENLSLPLGKNFWEKRLRAAVLTPELRQPWENLGFGTLSYI